MIWFASFMMLLVCAPGDERNGGPIWIDPLQLVLVFHARDTPDGCSTIMLSTGKTVYVQGTEQEILVIRDHALAQEP